MPDFTPVTLAGMAGERYGEPDDPRPPLVLLHGLTFDRTMWRSTIAELRRLQPDRRILCLDLPGHGESAPQDEYHLPDVTGLLLHAVIEAGFEDPVMVGHSLSAVLVTMYASIFPTGGVVNTDQTLDTGPFVDVVYGLRDELKGPGFPALWKQFAAGFHLEALPPEPRAFAASISRPDQALVLGYWNDLFVLTPAVIAQQAEQGLLAVGEKGMPYLSIFGSDIEPGYERWLTARVPQATFAVWPGCSHLPNLAHPDLFAKQLAATAGWPATSLLRVSSS